MLESIVLDAGGAVKEGQKLKTIFVSPIGEGSKDTRVSKVKYFRTDLKPIKHFC